jgi:hypothetical protein
MKLTYATLFGLIYTVVYFFLAVMSTGGGHGNFFLLTPITGWIFIFIALFLLTRLKSLFSHILFVGIMLAHYLINLLLLLSFKDEIIKDWNRVAGRTGIIITIGFYLLGQLIIWFFFFRSIRNQQILE